MVALWDILGKAANLAQLSGLDAIVLVTAVSGWLGIPQNQHQRRRLEDRVRCLRGMLQRSSATVRLLPGLDSALEDADSLVASYKNSSLWSIVRRGTRMADQFHEMHRTIDYVLMQASHTTLHHPGSAVEDSEVVQTRVSTAFNPEVRIEVNDGSEIATVAITESCTGSDQASTSPGIHRPNIGLEGICSGPDATASGCEIMPATTVMILPCTPHDNRR